MLLSPITVDSLNTSQLHCLNYTTTGFKVKVKVKVTLRLAVYRQSVRLGVKPLETHDQIFFFG
jgi:hypothetical protein